MFIYLNIHEIFIIYLGLYGDFIFLLKMRVTDLSYILSQKLMLLTLPQFIPFIIIITSSFFSNSTLQDYDNIKLIKNRFWWQTIFFLNIILKRKLFHSVISQFYILCTFFRNIIVPITLSLCFFLYSLFYFQLQIVKQLAIWFVSGILFFWLISGFNFFIKRYQFSKFTSQIQRFWKRTNIYFWLIEGFLISLYFYYFLNSSQEPLFMYDTSSLNQEYLISLNIIFINISILSLNLSFLYVILLKLPYTKYAQIILLLLMPTLLLLSSFFIETYQFLYVITSFYEDILVYIEEDNLWSITIDNPILRVKQQYLIMCLIAKYWHFLFIFISWIFLLMKSFEKNIVNYNLFGFNVQNIIILFFLNLLCYAQWLKWVYRRFWDTPYYTFFSTLNYNNVRILFCETYNLIFAFFNINKLNSYYNSFCYKSLLFWNVDSLALWKYI